MSYFPLPSFWLEHAECRALLPSECRKLDRRFSLRKDRRNRPKVEVTCRMELTFLPVAHFLHNFSVEELQDFKWVPEVRGTLTHLPVEGIEPSRHFTSIEKLESTILPWVWEHRPEWLRQTQAHIDREVEHQIGIKSMALRREERKDWPKPRKPVPEGWVAVTGQASSHLVPKPGYNPTLEVALGPEAVRRIQKLRELGGDLLQEDFRQLEEEIVRWVKLKREIRLQEG